MVEESNLQLERECEEVEREEDLMQLSIVEIKEIRFKNFRGDNSNSVVEQCERIFNVLDIFWEMDNSAEWNKNVYIFIYE